MLLQAVGDVLSLTDVQLLYFQAGFRLKFQNAVAQTEATLRRRDLVLNGIT